MRGHRARGNSLTNLLQQQLHVLRQRRMPFHHLAAIWMFQREARGVQRLAGETVQQVTQLRQAFLRTFQIHAITNQRMADGCQMHTNLVGAPGLQTAAQQSTALS